MPGHWAELEFGWICKNHTDIAHYNSTPFENDGKIIAKIADKGRFSHLDISYRSILHSVLTMVKFRLNLWNAAAYKQSGFASAVVTLRERNSSKQFFHTLTEFGMRKAKLAAKPIARFISGNMCEEKGQHVSILPKFSFSSKINNTQCRYAYILNVLNWLLRSEYMRRPRRYEERMKGNAAAEFVAFGFFLLNHYYGSGFVVFGWIVIVWNIANSYLYLHV